MKTLEQHQARVPGRLYTTTLATEDHMLTHALSGIAYRSAWEGSVLYVASNDKQAEAINLSLKQRNMGLAPNKIIFAHPGQFHRMAPSGKADDIRFQDFKHIIFDDIDNSMIRHIIQTVQRDEDCFIYIGHKHLRI